MYFSLIRSAVLNVHSRRLIGTEISDTHINDYMYIFFFCPTFYTQCEMTINLLKTYLERKNKPIKNTTYLYNEKYISGYK